jgi:hypothetical protein
MDFIVVFTNPSCAPFKIKWNSGTLRNNVIKNEYAL